MNNTGSWHPEYYNTDMEKNSFKELEELYIKERGNDGSEIRQNLGSNIQLFSLISNLIDLYLPKAGGVIQSLASFTNSGKSRKI